jgi:hypothetical protein
MVSAGRGRPARVGGCAAWRSRVRRYHGIFGRRTQVRRRPTERSVHERSEYRRRGRHQSATPLPRVRQRRHHGAAIRSWPQARGGPSDVAPAGRGGDDDRGSRRTVRIRFRDPLLEIIRAPLRGSGLRRPPVWAAAAGFGLAGGNLYAARSPRRFLLLICVTPSLSLARRVCEVSLGAHSTTTGDGIGPRSRTQATRCAKPPPADHEGRPVRPIGGHDLHAGHLQPGRPEPGQSVAPGHELLVNAGEPDERHHAAEEPLIEQWDE